MVERPNGIIKSNTILKQQYADKDKRIHPLTVILGEKVPRYSVVFLWILQYIFFSYMIYIQEFSPVLFLSLLVLPAFFKALKVYAKPRAAWKAPEGCEKI